MLQYGYTESPNSLLFNISITYTARFLYLILLGVELENNESWYSKKRLGEIMCYGDGLTPMADRTVWKYLEELKNNNLIEVKHRKGKTNVYRAKRIDMDEVKKDTLAPTCQSNPSTHVPSKLNKDSLSKLNLKTKAKKDLYKTSVNYKTAKALVEKYVTELPNLPKQRKKKTDIVSAVKQLTKRLDRGEELARFETAVANAIVAQGNGYNPDWIIGPRNLFSTMKTGGKFTRFLPNETDELYANVFGEENE